MTIFEQIFRKFDTDKCTGDYKYGYDEVFAAVREKMKLVFEIGVAHGGSVKAFTEYFPNALIVGLEIDKRWFSKGNNRFAIEIGDATKEPFISDMIKKYGLPDIVIDDGSHFSSDIKLSFQLLSPLAKFAYVIEDLSTQLITFYKGYYLNDNIPATTIINSEIDDLLLERKDSQFKSIRVYKGLCVFLKQYLIDI